MGGSIKNLVHLIYDPQTLKSFAGDAGVKLGTQAEASILDWGRSAQVSAMATNKGISADITLSYSRGLFGGLSVEGALVNPRPKVNASFYGKPATPSQILLDRAVEAPTEGNLLPELYAKLNALCSGQGIYELTDAEKTKVESVREKVDQEGEEAVKEEEVEYVPVEGAEEAK